MVSLRETVIDSLERTRNANIAGVTFFSGTRSFLPPLCLSEPGTDLGARQKPPNRAGGTFDRWTTRTARAVFCFDFWHCGQGGLLLI